MQFPKELRLEPSTQELHVTRSLNEVQFPKELRLVGRERSCTGGSLNEVQFPKELRPRRYSFMRVSGLASMKCSSRRNCDQSSHRTRPRDRASMKCSSRRNCDGPLSIARHHAHLRRLRERSALGLPLGHPTPHPTSQIPRRFNVLPLRALPGDPRAPERSHQAISGPSGVIVLVRPT